MAASYDGFLELQGVKQYQDGTAQDGRVCCRRMTPHLWAASVKMPVLMIQLLKDSWMRNPEDAQKTIDLLQRGQGIVLDREYYQTLQGRL